MVVHMLSKMELHSPRPTWLPLLLNDHLANSTKPILTPRDCTISLDSREMVQSLEGQARYLVAGGFYWTTSIMERTTLCSPWNNCLLWVWNCLPSLLCFCENFVTFRMPQLCHGISYHITSDQAVHFCNRWNMALGSCLWNPVLTMFSIALK